MEQTAGKVIERPLAFVTGVIALVTLLAYGGRWFWFCELLVTFRTHCALVLGLILVLVLVARLWGVGAIALLALALNVWPMLGVGFANERAISASAVPVRLVEFNVLVRNTNLRGIASYLESIAPDVVVLEEVTASSGERLVSLLPRFPHHYLAVDDGVRGILVLSRWPLLDPQTLLQGRGLYGVRAEVDLGDRHLRLHGLHLNWPLMPDAALGRNEQLPALARELAACRGACVAVGDFNTVPWSSHFRDLLTVSGFQDCAAGRGFLATWPAGLPAPLRIRIDHCLVSSAVSVVDVRVGEAIGSDHLATINDLSVALGE
jgi:endonuclease/exonuclease/phosphatase (EEP) superfamily protein YafD